jgi:hypothetical protein
MSKNQFCRVALAGLLLAGLSGAAFAANPPSSGLGQAWPNTTDVSANPNWHAYVFTMGGVEYVQINDLNGNVLGAVGTANGQFITLPIGVDSQLVSTPQQPAAVASSATATSAPTTVYQDSATTVTATSMSDGTVQLNAVSAAACSDPVVCSSQGVQQQ